MWIYYPAAPKRHSRFPLRGCGGALHPTVVRRDHKVQAGGLCYHLFAGIWEGLCRRQVNDLYRAGYYIIVTISMIHIPPSHLDLIDGPYIVVLSTVMPDGQPQVTPVWCNRKGDCIYINVMKGFRKERNMRANPRVSLLVYDPGNPLHNIEIRGLVTEMTEAGAVEHNDELTRLYLDKPDAVFFGDSVPVELKDRYTPVRVRIEPIHIRVEG